jgi:plastocyanin
MNRLITLQVTGAFMVLGLWVHSAAGAIVGVDIGIKGGGSPADSIVVLEPLDAHAPAADAGTANAQAIIDQVRKTFRPRVTVIRTGTAVTFPNSDNIHHEVYSFSPPHPFKLSMFANEPHGTVTFDKPGVLTLGCNIHDSMIAFLVVVDSPYFAKVPASGHTEMNVPPGRYVLRVWNETLRSSASLPSFTVNEAPLTQRVILDQDRENPEQWPD